MDSDTGNIIKMQNIDDVSSVGTNYGDVNISKNLEFWMSDLPPQLKILPINHLAIPGSHDTMTYTITPDAKIGPDGPKIIRHLGCLLAVAKPIIYHWSITQHDNVKDQLNGGIRYLDLRVARQNGTDDICFLHGMYGSTIDQPLRDISDWVTSHPGEVLILDFQHFYEFDDVLHQKLIKLIESTFREKLCPVFPSFTHISLQWLALEKYQLFVIYRNVAVISQSNLWFSSLWETPWADTVKPRNLIRFLDDKLKSRNSRTGFVSQCLLTPNSFYIARHTCGSLERDLACVCRNNILPWIRQNKPGSNGLNIVISDFVSYDDFVFSKTVIQRNVELLKPSNKTVSGRYIEVQSKSYN